MQAAVGPKVIAGVALAGASFIAVTPVSAPLEHHVSNAAVRLTSTDDILGDLGNLGGLTADLGNVDGLFSGLNLDGLQNIPYNLFADVVNIPYYESLALEEYAYALGPAGTPGGVAGWIPPGAPGFDNPTAIYTEGGTGSWYMESIGNTWGWDDGNWPQLDALLHFVLPFSFTEDLADEVQTFAQSELIDGANVDCEFECANPLAYLGGWLHGDTSLESLFTGTNFPDTLQGDISDPLGQFVIWANQPGANLLEPLQALAGSLTADPSTNPIEFPDLGSVFTNSVQLFEDNMNDFNPFVTGSFLYWGAATDYSIPSAIGGTIEDFTGIPNQWGLLNDGAEPSTATTSTVLNLPSDSLQGLEYFFTGQGGVAGNGLLGYLDPVTYLQALENDFTIFTNPNDLLASLPLVGYLGLGNNAGDVGYGALLGTLETVLGDPSGSSADPLTSLLESSSLTTDLSGLLSGGLGTDLGSLGTGLATDLTTLPSTLATDLGATAGTSLATLAPDLVSQLLASI
jgi:hypothetical protein